MTLPVVVLGDALLDIRVVPSQRAARGTDAPAAIDVGPGGQGANVAVRLARRGVPVELVAAIGADAAGTVVRDSIRAEGVVLREVAAEATGTVVVLGDPDGERTMYSQRAPFADLIDPMSTDADGWTVVSGYLLQEPSAMDFARNLSRHAGRRALLGCSVPAALVAHWRDAAAALAPDLWILNRDELLRLDPGGADVAVTDAGGATVSVGGVHAESRARSDRPAVDTTGAGDAFAAALVDGLRRLPWPPPRDGLGDAVEGALALASRVAGVAGAQARVAGELPATLVR